MAVYQNPVAFTNRDLINNAASTIGQMFAPPSAADVYNYTRARAANEEASRLADLYTQAGSPDVDQTRFDRLGQAAGRWTPSTGYYGVDQGEQTARMKNEMANQTELTKFFNEDVNAGTGDTVYLSPGRAQAMGLPQGQSSLAGMFKVGEDEQAILPGGQTVSGPRGPLTKSEVEGSILAGLTPEMQQAIVFGNTPVENVIGSDGNPVISTRMAAVGQTPYQAPKAGELYNYQTGSGRSGVAEQTPQGLVDAQTREPLPQDVRTFKANLTGGAEETGLGPTKSNITDANAIAAELVGVEDTLNRVEQLALNNPGLFGLAGRIRGTAQNAIQTVVELAQAYGGENPELNTFANDVQNGLGALAQGGSREANAYFDPDVPKARKLMYELAYANARIQNPRGEVGQRALERSLEDLGGDGLLANNESVLAAVQAMRESLRGRSGVVDRLRNPQAVRDGQQPQQPSGTPTVNDVVDGYRFLGGNPNDPNNWEAAR